MNDGRPESASWSNTAYDVLIVGAGPAGLAAAWRAAHAGSSVAVVDDNPTSGGQIWRGEQSKPSSPEAQIWLERILSENIRFIPRARIFQQTQPGKLLAETAHGVTELSYTNLILATGARERFLPFPGWTLPNVMGAGGLQALVKTGLSIEGKKVVIAGSGPLLLAVAAYLRAHGANVLLIAEQASSFVLASFVVGLFTQPNKSVQAIEFKRQLRGVKYLNGCWPVAAHGDTKLTGVTLYRSGKRWQVKCDYLACGFHLVPNLELAELFGCKMENGAVSVDQFQQTSLPQIYAAGEATGIGGLELSLIEGEIAGLAAANKHDEARKLFGVRKKQRKFARVLNATFALRKELRDLATSETLVCRCEDVEFGRLRGYDSWRSAKLQTRCGMGPCQGRVCGPAVEFLFGWNVESVRPPVFPVKIESMLSHKEAQEAQSQVVPE
ncbi:MAG TPA: FAD/NAD(P)-binding oxidoreductase [Pyrinomonadaceae bacterium]|jgi:NADPH-dependent 2,4-dienoyl-CoA reductase/sulfur reductase-like enzyme